MLPSLQVLKQGADAQVFFCFALLTNLIVSALLVLGGSAVITAVTGMSRPQRNERQLGLVTMHTARRLVCVGELSLHCLLQA